MDIDQRVLDEIEGYYKVDVSNFGKPVVVDGEMVVENLCRRMLPGTQISVRGVIKDDTFYLYSYSEGVGPL